MLAAAPLLSSAQAPPGAPPLPFDPKALQATLEAFDKVPDTPGTGKYPAIKETVASLPDHVVYRPADLSKLGREKLGVLAWGNGGCAADGAGARLHLEETASHGYLAIANGKILSGPGAPPHSAGGFPGGGPPPDGPPPGGTRPGVTLPGGPAAAGPAPGGPAPPFSIPPPATQAEGLRQAITWALAENTRAGSPYFGRINPNWVAISGWSCGGLQALEIAADRRVHTVIIHSSGIFNTGANAIPGMTITKAALKKLHTPILYILGGPKDIAYANGMDDFKQIDTVPVMVANLDVGHGGTFMEPNGGLEASVAVSWLDWQLKGNTQAAQRFVGPDCGLCKDPVWQVERKRIAPAR
jgi:hypothetical protein